jgi:hypothetical protein
MRLGTGSAQGWAEVQKGETASGLAKIGGEVSSAVLIVIGGARAFGRAPTGPTGTAYVGYKPNLVGHVKILIEGPGGRTLSDLAITRGFKSGALGGARTVLSSLLQEVARVLKAETKSPVKAEASAATWRGTSPGTWRGGYVWARMNLPLAQVEAMLKHAMEQASAGESAYSVFRNSCSTYVAGVGNAGGVFLTGMTPFMTFLDFALQGTPGGALVGVGTVGTAAAQPERRE